MSFHRENITWQNESGIWSIGIYKATVVGDDPEWDVEYDYSTFEWAATGFSSSDQASNAPSHNLGFYGFMDFSEKDRDAIEELNSTLEKYLAGSR